MARCFRQLQRSDRLRLEKLLKQGKRKADIARDLGVHRSTIYNELKRGQYEHLNSDYTREMRYSPDIAQRKYEENLQVRGTQLKIGKDRAYAEYIERKIVDDGYSPAAVLGELKAQGREKEFSTKICVATCYSYIEKGVFPTLTNKDLPVKGKRRRKYRRIRKVQSRASAGESIERRPKEIQKRKEFGHWEMDSVIGKKDESQNTLLVLTERKTRMEMIFKLPSKEAGEVVKAIDGLEARWGALFPKIFKTITVDNGSEFAYCTELERSIYGGQNRTKLYYCHPYSSWERGTNEVTNKMVRRKVPKGSNFDHLTQEDVKEIEVWINNYPRRIFGFHTSEELFREELSTLQAAS